MLLSHNELGISNRIIKPLLEIFVRRLMEMRSWPVEGEKREDRAIEIQQLNGEVWNERRC